MATESNSGVLSVTLATVGALVIGLVGLWAVFTDIGPADSVAKRMLLMAAVYGIGAAAVGALVPRRWYLSLVAAWGPIAFGLLGLVVKLTSGGPTPYWGNLALALLVVPILAMGFGYIGARVRENAAPASRSAS